MMHLQIGKKLKFFFYTLLIIFLTTINNYNFKNVNLFKIKNIEVNGFSKNKNTIVASETKHVIEKNIFFLKKKYFIKLKERNDTKYLNIKKKYPNELIVNITPAKPVCIIIYQNNKFFLGDNGKKLDFEVKENDMPIVKGSKNINNIFKLVNLIKLSNLDYSRITKINFFKSGRFDINLDNGTIIKFPIKYNQEIINYSSDLLFDKKFANSKIIDLRIKNRIIKYE